MSNSIVSPSTQVSAKGPIISKPTDRESAIRQARREVRLKEAQWHRKRAEVARLIAAGEEAAADELLGLSSKQTKKQLSKSHASATDKSVERVRSGASSNGPNNRRNDKGSEVLSCNHVGPTRKKSLHQGGRIKPNPVEDLSVLTEDWGVPTKRSDSKPKEIAKSFPQKARTSIRRQSKRTTFRRLLDGWSLWLSKRPAWAVSLTLHIVMLLALMLATFVTFHEDPFVLTATISDREEWTDEIPEINLVNWQVETESLEIETKLESLSIEPVLEPIDIPLEDPLEAPLLDSLPTGANLLSEVPTSLASTASEKGKGKGETPSDANKQGASPTASTGRVSFFGVQERADRVVFVVDNSGSMQRGRMETTLNELNRAVQSLSPHQSYYVIFYSDQAYPMFFPQSVDELQPATRDSKRHFAKWLRTVEICLGGRLLDAIELAASFDPQVVFLMSDGDIRSQRVMQSLTQADAWPFTIHSFGMEVRTKQHAENLAAISHANEGEFRVVEVRPKAIRQSMQRPIPYHREPGNVWGSKVQVW